MSREVSFASACVDLNSDGSTFAFTANGFNMPANSQVKVYGCVIWLATDATCTPGVVRAQLNGNPQTTEVSISRTSCVAVSVTRRLWMRMPYGSDYRFTEPHSTTHYHPSLTNKNEENSAST